MFKSVLVIGHIRGIRIEIHVSWLVIFALLMFALSAGFQQHYPDWSMTVVLFTALLTILIFFASIVAHELGHSLVAIRRGVPVNAITLFIFGGVAQLSRDSETARDEFWIAIAGPAVSFALALIFALLSGATAAVSEPISVGLGWLALINFVVAVFNLIPGFPLDGGRVFRALVWMFTGDARTGMKAAVMGGRLVAYGLFGLGLWSMLAVGNLIGGLWIMVIAWFLLNSAEASGRHFDLSNRLRGVCASDVTDPEVPLVAENTPVDQWIEQEVLHSGKRTCFVGTRDTIRGLVTLTDARRVPRDRWTDTMVEDIMTPTEKLVAVKPDTPVNELLQLMSEKNLNQVPVMEGSKLIGWIDRQRMLRTIEIHMELQA